MPLPNPKFQLYPSGNEYRFRLKAKNGQNILASEGYTSKALCQNGIQSVKVNALIGSGYDRKIASNGQFYFNLKAGNGEIIGTSELYTTEVARENGIASVKTNAPIAPVEDLT